MYIFTFMHLADAYLKQRTLKIPFITTCGSWESNL